MTDPLRHERERSGLPHGRPLVPFGLFVDTVNAVVDRYQEARKQAVVILPRHSRAPGATGREQPPPHTSSTYRDTETESSLSCTPQRGRGQWHSVPGTARPKTDRRAVI